MIKKLIATAGAGGIGAVIGGLVGGILGVLGTGLYSAFFIIPYFTAQTQTAPDWLWVAIVIGLVPSAIVVLLGLIVGIALGALVVGLCSMLFVGVMAAVATRNK